MLQVWAVVVVAKQKQSRIRLSRIIIRLFVVFESFEKSGAAVKLLLLVLLFEIKL